MKENQPNNAAEKAQYEMTRAIMAQDAAETARRSLYDSDPVFTGRAVDRKVRRFHKQGRVKAGWHPDITSRTIVDPHTREETQEAVTPVKVTAKLYSRIPRTYTVLYPTVIDHAPVNMAIEPDPASDQTFSPWKQTPEMNAKVASLLETGRAIPGWHPDIDEIVIFGQSALDIRLAPITPVQVSATIAGETNFYTVFQENEPIMNRGEVK